MDFRPRRSTHYSARHIGKDESKTRSMAIAATAVLVVLVLALVGIHPAEKAAPKVMMGQPLAVALVMDRTAAQAHDQRVLGYERHQKTLGKQIRDQNRRLADLVKNTGAWETRLRQARISAAKKKIAAYVRPNLSAIKRFALEKVGSYQFKFLDLLWTRESNWQWNATNPSSGAYGIPQSLPGSKMASAGADWRTNPYTQIRWGLGYIAEVYGSPENAWAHSQQTGWY